MLPQKPAHRTKPPEHRLSRLLQVARRLLSSLAQKRRKFADASSRGLPLAPGLAARRNLWQQGFCRTAFGCGFNPIFSFRSSSGSPLVGRPLIPRSHRSPRSIFWICFFGPLSRAPRRAFLVGLIVTSNAPFDRPNRGFRRAFFRLPAR